MIFGGDGRDVARSDPRSVRRTMPRGRDGPSDVGTTAPAGAAGSDLRGRQATAIHQATPLLSGRCGDGGGRHPDPRLGPLRLSRHEGAVGGLGGRALRQAQPHRTGDLLGPGPRDRRRRRQGDRRDARGQEGGLAGVGGLLPRRQPPGVDRAPRGGTPRHARRAVAGASPWRSWTRSGS